MDSTNNACKRLAAEGAPDGTAIPDRLPDRRKGPRGRTFVSPPGGLYFSVILRPHAKPEALMHLTAMAAVAAARAVFAVSGVYPDIKWTNDLVLGGKKLCGILTEIGIEAESREVDYAVVGIGINCARVDLPPEVSAMSASLEAFTGQKPDRRPVSPPPSSARFANWSRPCSPKKTPGCGNLPPTASPSDRTSSSSGATT